MSVSNMCEVGYQAVLDIRTACICNIFKLVFQGHLFEWLYYLCTPSNMSTFPNMALISDLSTWHASFAHMSIEVNLYMTQNKMALGLMWIHMSSCSTATSVLLGDHQVSELPSNEGPEKKTFDPVHSGVCGLMHVQPLQGSLYFVTFVNGHNKFYFLYMLETK